MWTHFKNKRTGSGEWATDTSHTSLVDRDRRAQTTRWIAQGATAISLVYAGVYSMLGGQALAITALGFAIIYLFVAAFLVKVSPRNAAILVLTTGLVHISALQFLVMSMDPAGSSFLLVIPPFALMTMDKKDRLWMWVISLIAVSLFALRQAGIEVGPQYMQLRASSEQETHMNLFSATVAGLFLTAVFHLFYRDLLQAREKLQEAHEQSEALLLNILPESIAERLKHDTEALADGHDVATVLFADIVGFTQLSSRLEPNELVAMLNTYFTAFDRLVGDHGLEKIKTIGDAYMVAGGVPVPTPDHAERVLAFALGMLETVETLNRELNQELSLRIGVNMGPVTAGVIGERKFIYDLWGDTVNVASRMESTGIVGRIQVTEAIAQEVGHTYIFEKRGPVDIKGKGTMDVYLLKGPATHVSEG